MTHAAQTSQILAPPARRALSLPELWALFRELLAATFSKDRDAALARFQQKLGEAVIARMLAEPGMEHFSADDFVQCWRGGRFDVDLTPAAALRERRHLHRENIERALKWIRYRRFRAWNARLFFILPMTIGQWTRQHSGRPATRRHAVSIAAPQASALHAFTGRAIRAPPLLC